MSDGIGLAEALLGLDGFRVLAVDEVPDEFTSSTFKPISSPRRIPVSLSSRMMGSSRRSSNDLLEQVLSSASMSARSMTGTGCSGTAGGRLFAIGLAST